MRGFDIIRNAASYAGNAPATGKLFWELYNLFVHLRPDRTFRATLLAYADRGFRSGLHNHENWFGFLQAGHVYLRPSHHFCSAGIEPHVHLLAAALPIDSASS